MKLLIFIGIAFAVIVCIPLRIILKNPLKTFKYSISDIIGSIIHKSWNYAPVGFIHAYTGLFGQGKTLSSVEYVVRYYEKYNNKTVYDPFRHKFVIQLVNVLSNVHLTIPYSEFKSLSQIVDVAEQVGKINEENDFRIVTIVLGDEFSVQMNSRNFKSNLDPLTLSAILTCRHHGISLIYTAQRFNHVDALLRQVTEMVIECKKIWRIQCLNYYDGNALENAGSPMQIKPVKRRGFFVQDKHYNAYDSIATVENLIKEYKSGAMISEERILALQGSGNDTNVFINQKRKRRGRKKRGSA